MLVQGLESSEPFLSEKLLRIHILTDKWATGLAPNTGLTTFLSPRTPAHRALHQVQRRQGILPDDLRLQDYIKPTSPQCFPFQGPFCPKDWKLHEDQDQEYAVRYYMPHAQNYPNNDYLYNE